MTIAIFLDLAKRFSSFCFKHWILTLIVIGGLIVSIWIGNLTRENAELEKKAKAAQSNANASASRADGLEIIVDAKPQAAEIEREKEKGNEQSKNTNISANDFNFSVNRDSGTFTGNSTDRFCARFCHDSTCAVWRSSHDCR